MICQDCRPVFYGPDEVPPDAAVLGRLVVKHVELCPRHQEMEEQRDELSVLIAEARERRRHALLQAAATLFCADVDDAGNLAGEAVDIAGKLLAEIEKREKGEKGDAPPLRTLGACECVARVRPDGSGIAIDYCWTHQQAEMAAHLEEALLQYADPKNWACTCHDYDCERSELRWVAGGQGPDIAREALEEPDDHETKAEASK